MLACKLGATYWTSWGVSLVTYPFRNAPATEGMLAVTHDWIYENFLADRAKEYLLNRGCLRESSLDLDTHFRLFFDKLLFSFLLSRTRL